MRLTVRYFAVLRERRGTDCEIVALSDGATAASAFALLFPDLALPVAFAVNQEMVPGDTALAANDELAFLPPLGGG